LTPGAIVDNHGVALTTTEIVVLETPVDTSGVKHVGDITGDLTGSASKFGGDTQAEHAAKLKCVIHSAQQASTDNFTFVMASSIPLLFPAPLKSNTVVSVYGPTTNNNVGYIASDGSRTSLQSWADAGSRNVTIPAGAIGIVSMTSSNIYLSVYFTYTV